MKPPESTVNAFVVSEHWRKISPQLDLEIALAGVRTMASGMRDRTCHWHAASVGSHWFDESGRRDEKSLLASGGRVRCSRRRQTRSPPLSDVDAKIRAHSVERRW